jgi:nucleotide-binding universal stress UspA family protein
MHQILCPVDFSEVSAAALRYAGEFARSWEAQITVVYAEPFSPPPYFTHAQIADLEQSFRESRAQAETVLRSFVAKALGEGVEAALRIVDAPPAEAIHRVATEVAADLIIMGTHGRTGIRRLALGSVAEKVLRESEVPVLTVRGTHRG